MKDATTEAAKIRAWFTRWPEANIGIATGQQSRLIVLDVDPRHSGEESLKHAAEIHGTLCPTWTVLTGGRGRHLYFRDGKPGIKTSHGKFGEGVDVQAEGAYVVAPPSRHVSGLRYVWKTGLTPDTALALLPRRYRSVLSGKASPDPAVARSTELAVVNVVEGQRNAHLTSLGGRLVAAGVFGPTLLAALAGANASFVPPLEESEVRKVVASVSRYDPNEQGDEAERIAKAFIQQRFETDGQRHLLFAPDGQFWHFETTHWRPSIRSWLDGEVLRYVQTWPRRKGTSTASLIRQIVTLLEAMTATNDDLLRFKSDPLPVINCLNGELWLDADGEVTLRPHSAGSYLTHQLPVLYNPSATCPRFDRAVAEIFSRTPDPKALVKFWHELAGYAIQTRRNIALIVICKGGGSNGKTALLETIVRLIGRDLVAAMPVEDLDKSRFTIGGLLGKQLFLDDDVKTGTKLPDGSLKRLSEAKTITGEHKFGRQFTFTVRTLPVLLCNNPPSLSDLSHGMRRRLLVVPFDRTFAAGDVDKTLFPTIWEHEMSGVLNRCIGGLKSVVHRGWELSCPEPLRAAKESWLLEANPLPAFLEDCCETSGQCYVEDLYRAFIEWTQARGVTWAQQRTSFDRNIESCGYRFGNKGNRGKRVVGLSLKSSPRR